MIGAVGLGLDNKLDNWLQRIPGTTSDYSAGKGSHLDIWERMELLGYGTQMNRQITAAWQEEFTGEEKAARLFYL